MVAASPGKVSFVWYFLSCKAYKLFCMVALIFQVFFCMEVVVLQSRPRKIFFARQLQGLEKNILLYCASCLLHVFFNMLLVFCCYFLLQRFSFAW